MYTTAHYTAKFGPPMLIMHPMTNNTVSSIYQIFGKMLPRRARAMTLNRNWPNPETP